MNHAPALMAAMLGDDNYRDIVAVLDGLTRLEVRGTISSDLHGAFIEVLADDLVCQQMAKDIVAGLLPAADDCADTAPLEEPCNDSSSD